MPSRLINYLQLLRAPAVFTALSNTLAAHLIATQGGIQWSSLLPLSIASAMLYSAGMVLNDCFDYAEDCRDRPARPLPSGRITLKDAWRFGWLLMAAGLLFAGLAGYGPFVIALILVALIIVYDGYAKHSIFGVPAMGGCRYLNWLLGLSVIPFQPSHFILALPIFIYVASLTLLSTVETSATRKVYVIFSFAGILACAAVILFIQLTAPLSPQFSPLLLLVLLMPIAARMIRTYQDFSPPQIQKTIKFLIMGIIPLDALLVFSNGLVANAVVILSLLLPGWLLARSMRVT
jgi:4-hydroxybenzoate polyprenyltransferase